MQIALIGFSKSGKTTVFNTLTGSNAEVSAFSGKAKTHRATVQVPDPRLDQLNDLFQSKKLVHATIDYVDPVGIRRDQAGQGSAMGDEMLNNIATADALVAVIRAFDDDSGVETAPEADFETIQLELILSDLTKVDNRLGRAESQMQRIGGPQRKALEEECAVLKRLKEALEAGQPVRSLELDAEEAKYLRSFQFLTTKALITLVNTGGQNETEVETLLASLRQKAAGTLPDGVTPLYHFLALCGQTEMEIAQLAEEDRALFLEEYGITEPGMARMIRLCYDALGLISFFTVGPSESHAWTLRRGLPAVEAAGVIHSDLQRGFIRAQIISWKDMLAVKTYAEAKKQALLRQEGRDYVMQDGDIIEVLFSV